MPKRIFTCACGQPALKKGSKCYECDKVYERNQQKARRKRMQAGPAVIKGPYAIMKEMEIFHHTKLWEIEKGRQAQKKED